MEKRFEADFGEVQSFTGRSELRDVGANAAAKGSKVAFVKSNPSRSEVAHELTHVQQQRAHGIQAEAASRDVSELGDGAEIEAEENASIVAAEEAEGADGAAGEPLSASAAPGAKLHLDRGTGTGPAAKAAVRPATKQISFTHSHGPHTVLIATNIELARFHNEDAKTDWRLTVKRTLRFRIEGWPTITFTSRGTADMALAAMPGKLESLIRQPAAATGHDGAGTIFGQDVNLDSKIKAPTLAATIAHHPLISYTSTPKQRFDALFKLIPKARREQLANTAMDRWEREIERLGLYPRLRRYGYLRRRGRRPNRKALADARRMLRRLNQIEAPGETIQRRSRLYGKLRRALRRAENARPQPKSRRRDVGKLAKTVGKLGVDIGTDFIPGVSNVKDAHIASTGINPVTGEKVGFWGRLLSGIFAIPGIGNVLKIVGKGGGKLLFELGKKLGVDKLVSKLRQGGGTWLRRQLTKAKDWVGDKLGRGQSRKQLGPGTARRGAAAVGHPGNFASHRSLFGHYKKHAAEFGGAYNSPGAYARGAQDVMRNGTPVDYMYKGERRRGYVKFMGNSRKGVAKFEFVGTNSHGFITTYHTKSGKEFWKLLNGNPHLKVITPAQ